MRFAILDACGKATGLAYAWLQWECGRLGMTVVSPEIADVILLTAVSADQVPFVKGIRRKYPRAKLFVGGAAALSPASLSMHCDAVVVGSGREFLTVLRDKGPDEARLMSNVFVHGETRPVTVSPGFPWDLPPVQAEDGAYRVWCGRGCKMRCAFCQTGWGLPYEENPDPDGLLDAIGRLKNRGKKWAYLSNDPGQHSFFRRLPPVDHGSHSIQSLRRGLPSSRMVRIGVEGVSERLRKAVGKPISRKDLIQSCLWLWENGRSVRWFMIAGLPFEIDDDWDEQRSVVQELKRRSAKGVLELSFTAWVPKPASPIGILPLDDRYWPRFEAFREWFFSSAGWSNRVKLWNPRQPESRLREAEWSMCLSEEQLRAGGNWGENDRVLYPYKHLRDAATRRYLQSLGEKWPTSSPPPTPAPPSRPPVPGRVRTPGTPRG